MLMLRRASELCVLAVIVARHSVAAFCAAHPPTHPALPVRPAYGDQPRVGTQHVSMRWAGQSKAGKLFSLDNIPSGMEPWAFYLGLGVLLVSNVRRSGASRKVNLVCACSCTQCSPRFRTCTQFGVVALVLVSKASPDSLPPLNALTAISNAAMEQAVAAGDIPKPMATFWAQRYWFDLIGEFQASKIPATEFITQWCSDASHHDLCLTAKSSVGT